MMFLKGCNFDTYMWFILQMILKDTSSCSTQVCLTWEAHSGNITFRCKVNHLTWKVEIYNPLNEEQGHCLNPLPNSKCFPQHNNTMFQERRTNTTILILKKSTYRNLTGSWKCYHGTNRDKAIVIVTDLKQESIKMFPENGNCFEEHLAWTFIGVAICVIAILFIKTFYHLFKEKLVSFQERNTCTRKDICRERCLFSPNCCYDKEYFIIFGVCMVFMFVICLLIPRTGEQNEPPADLETNIQQLLNREKEVAEKNKSEEEE